MVEPVNSDVWLCRLEGDDKNRLLAISRMFRVDVRGAHHILEHLPRLVARDLPEIEARKLAHRLRETGGVVHVCGTGETPDFGATLAAPVRKAARQAPARRRPRAGDDASALARATQDAAMARWPKETEPCAWETEGASRPPPVPAAVRHSAARVAFTLFGALSLIGGGGGAYWARYGKEILAVSVAQVPEPRAAASQRADRGRDAGVARETSGDPQRAELARRLAETAAQAAFQAAAGETAKALAQPGEPLQIEQQSVGLSFELPQAEVEARLQALEPTAAAHEALLLRNVKQSRPGFDRVVLLPTPDPLQAVQLIGTAGEGISNAEIVSWLRALHDERPFRLLGVGASFVEGRFETQKHDEGRLDQAAFSCPGRASARGGVEADGIRTLERLHHSSRFACTWP